MPNSRAPGFIEMEYHSLYGFHVRELPVNTVNIDTGDPNASTIDDWTGGTVSWRTMASELSELLADRLPTTSVIDRATLWAQPLPTDLPLFVDSFSLADTGTVSPSGYTKAVQETLTARDTGGYVAKLVSLDMASGDNFDVQVTPTAAGVADLIDAWFAETNGWSSQAGFRPSTFIKATRTLNESLRRRYRQT